MKAAHPKKSNKKMIITIETWKTDDGLIFNSEIEAVRHENKQLKQELNELKWHLSYQKGDVLYYDENDSNSKLNNN